MLLLDVEVVVPLLLPEELELVEEPELDLTVEELPLKLLVEPELDLTVPEF